MAIYKRDILSKSWRRIRVYLTLPGYMERGNAAFIVIMLKNIHRDHA